MNPLMNISGGYGENLLGYFFITHTYYIMTPIFLAFVFLIVINFKTIKNQFSRVDKITWLILLFIFIVGFCLRNTNYRYGDGLDGFFAQDIAKTLYETNVYAKGCAIGNIKSCRLYHGHLFPPGYPYLITLLFHLFGEHDILAMYISGVLSSLTIILVFCITYLLFSNERMGLYAALIFALIPLDIFISSTGATRPTSNFFIALTILFYLIGIKKNKTKLWSLVAITFVYSVYTKQENLILSVPLITGLFLFGYFKIGQFKNFKAIKEVIISSFKKFLIPIILVLIITFPIIHWSLVENLTVSQEQPAFSIKYTKVLTPVILRTLFFKSDMIEYFYIPIISSLFIITIFFIIKKNHRNSLIFLWLLFSVYFILSASWFQCVGFPEDFCMEFIRYLQHFHIYYAILAGFTLSFVEKIKINKNIIFLVIFILLISSIKPSFYIFKDGRMNEPFVKGLVTAINKTPQNSLVFVSQSSFPNFDLVRTKERRWIDIDMIFANNFVWAKEEVNENINLNKPIIFIEDYRCRDYKDECCEFIYDNFDFELLDQVEDIKIYKITRIEFAKKSSKLYLHEVGS